MAENFPNLVEETDIWVQESQRVPNKMNTKKSTPRTIVIKMSKVKNKKTVLKWQEGNNKSHIWETP